MRPACFFHPKLSPAKYKWAGCTKSKMPSSFYIARSGDGRLGSDVTSCSEKLPARPSHQCLRPRRHCHRRHSRVEKPIPVMAKDLPGRNVPSAMMTRPPDRGVRYLGNLEDRVKMHEKVGKLGLRIARNCLGRRSPDLRTWLPVTACFMLIANQSGQAVAVDITCYQPFPLAGWCQRNGFGDEKEPPFRPCSMQIVCPAMTTTSSVRADADQSSVDRVYLRSKKLG